MYGVEDFDVITIKIVHFTTLTLNLFIEVLKRLNHELDTVGGKVFVDIRFDLLGREDESWNDFLFECFELRDECCIVDKSEVSMEEENVHICSGTKIIWPLTFIILFVQ